MIPYGVDRIMVWWNKTRWGRRTTVSEARFTEAIDPVPARSRITTRLRTAVGSAIGEAPARWPSPATPFSSWL